jgi:hypothetical protein
MTTSKNGTGATQFGEIGFLCQLTGRILNKQETLYLFLPLLDSDALGNGVASVSLKIQVV